MIVGNVHSPRWVPLILLVLISLQAAHDLIQINSLFLRLVALMLLTVTLSTHLHHAEQVFVFHGDPTTSHLLICVTDIH